MMVKPDYEYDTICFEIIKSMLIWLHVAESRFNTSIIKGDVMVQIFIDEDLEEPALYYNDRAGIYRYFVNVKNFNNNFKELEQFIITKFLFLINENENIVNPSFGEIMNTVFEECKGQVLQGPDYSDILLDDDGIRDLYEVDDRCCDIVLDNIRKFLDHKDAALVLSKEWSRTYALKIQDYIGQEINRLLSDYNSIPFLTSLLKLHHALQYWKYTVNNRFYYINSIMQFLGGDYENQLTSAEKYTETDILTCFLIERIICCGFRKNEGHAPSIEHCDMLFAYAKQYYTVCLYLDLLTKTKEGTELEILESGRIAYPMDLLDKFRKYFSDLREEDFFRYKEKSKQFDMFPEYHILSTDKMFYEAFQEEFGMSFDSYTHICQLSIDYGVENGGVVNITEEEFIQLIKDKEPCVQYDVFSRNFVLAHDLIEELDLKDSEFWPHRYNRQFQISTRPWIKYENRILFSNKSVSVSNRVFLERLNSGIYVPKSDKMISYMAQVKQDKGKSFNRNVYSYIVKNHNEGVTVRQEVPIRPGKELTSKTNLGDIDILIIDRPNHTIKCLELKNYIECKYLWKVLSQQSQLKEDLKKVAKRDKWCRQHIKEFHNICKDIDSSYNCETLFLTYNIFPKDLRQEINSDVKCITMLDVINDPSIICCKKDSVI